MFLILYFLTSCAYSDSNNPYSPNSSENAYGAGSPYSDVQNPYGRYRDPYSDQNPDNPSGQGIPSVPDSE